MQTIKFVSATEAVKAVKSGDRIHIHGVAGAPDILIDALIKRASELKDVKIQHIHTEGSADYANEAYQESFYLQSFFVADNVRKQTQAGWADYVPANLNETQHLIRTGTMRPDVVFCTVSKPDKHGYVSLGTSVEATYAAIECGTTVIACINPNMPRTFGHAVLKMNEFDIFVDDDSPLWEMSPIPTNDTDEKIADNIAALIPDGATLQMGIGALPNAVLSRLHNHKDLGVHTEMFAEGVLPLVAKGVINGKKKKIDVGRLTSTFLMGSKKLWDFIDDNPAVLMMDVRHTNTQRIIAKNPKVVAINAAISIDITGQVNADSVGTKFYSGCGGQLDFIRGAAMSEGGVPIIAMHARTAKGVSKIVDTLLPGAGVVTPRHDMRWFVTEYGAVNLWGKTLQERAKAIIQLAHPGDREALDKAAFARYGSHFHFVKNNY